MSNTYLLEILTPERCFFSGEVESLIFHAGDGEWAVLSGHEPMVAVLSPDSLYIKQNGLWHEAVNSEGYMEVAQHGVVVFAQTCEWIEEVDQAQAEQARLLAEELMRQSRSQAEFRNSQILLARAMARLRISQKNVNLG